VIAEFQSFSRAVDSSPFALDRTDALDRRALRPFCPPPRLHIRSLGLDSPEKNVHEPADLSTRNLLVAPRCSAPAEGIPGRLSEATYRQRTF